MNSSKELWFNSNLSESKFYAFNTLLVKNHVDKLNKPLKFLLSVSKM